MMMEGKSVMGLWDVVFELSPSHFPTIHPVILSSDRSDMHLYDLRNDSVVWFLAWLTHQLSNMLSPHLRGHASSPIYRLHQSWVVCTLRLSWRLSSVHLVLLWKWEKNVPASLFSHLAVESIELGWVMRAEGGVRTTVTHFGKVLLHLPQLTSARFASFQSQIC